MSVDTPRRAFLAGASALASLPLAGFAARPTAPIDVQTPANNLRNIVRVLGDADGGDVLYWFHGFIYAVTPGQRPFPLVHFNGVNAMRFTQQDDGSYFSRHHSISFMEDLASHELLASWTNPLTGGTCTPKPNTFRGSVYDYAVQGTKMRAGEWDSATPFTPGMWTFGDQTAWVTIDRPYASRFGYPWSEARTYEADLSDLADPEQSSVLCRQHSTVTNPYPSWMEMGDVDGYALWQANGRKLRNADQLPPHIYKRCEDFMPEMFDYDVFN